MNNITADSPNQLLRAALQYASRGWAVLPLKPGGKTPLTKHGVKNASINGNQICAWWQKWPNANVGIATGEISGIFVLDLDRKKGADGIESLEILKLVEGDLPDTMAVQTGNGGQHLFFEYPDDREVRNSASKLAPGVDVRGCGGYVVTPPSTLDGGGAYTRIDSHDITQSPDWLLDLVCAPKATTSAVPVDPLDVAQPLGLPRERILDALSALDASDYDLWLRVGLALHHETTGGEHGLMLWDDWSQGAPNYAGHTDLERRWRGFATAGNGRVVTMRSVLSAAKEQQAADAPDSILDIADHLSVARAFRDHLAPDPEGHPRLLYSQGEWLMWTGSHWAERTNRDIRAALWAFLDGRLVSTDKGVVALKPKTPLVSFLLDALKGVTHLSDTTAAPSWLDRRTQPAAHELIALRNGLLHVPSGVMHAHSPQFFNHNALPFDWTPGSAEPARWLSFLDSVWTDDPEAISTLQEIVGYLLLPDTSQQKIFLFVGPKRSGKGTIFGVLRALLGRDNVCSPTLNALVTQFGLAALIGKTAALVGDARLSNRADQQVIAERLLGISGEDGLNIPRKYSSDWVGQLSTRFVIASNELPRIADASGALASRYIVLRFRKSFYGHEDRGLAAALRSELPGIFQWALAGLERLRARGHFVQPESGREAIEAIEELASPVSAFIRDQCELGGAFEVPRQDLFEAWQRWCLGHGRVHPGEAATFGRNLQAAVPEINTTQPRNGHQRVRIYTGICLSPVKNNEFG